MYLAGTDRMSDYMVCVPGHGNNDIAMIAFLGCGIRPAKNTGKIDSSKWIVCLGHQHSQFLQCVSCCRAEETGIARCAK